MRPNRLLHLGLTPALLGAAAAAACGSGAPQGEVPFAADSGEPGPDWPDEFAEYDAALGDAPEYRAIQRELARGWNTWDSRSVLRYVRLPDGLTVDLALKRHSWLDEDYLATALVGRRGEDVERIRPGLHARDGSFLELEIEWRGFAARVEAGRSGKDPDSDLLVLVTPLDRDESEYPDAWLELVVGVGLAWNRPGSVERAGAGFRAELGAGTEFLHLAGAAVEDPYTGSLLPHAVLRLDRPAGISGGRARSLGEIRDALDARRAAFLAQAAEFGPLAEPFSAVVSGLAWNTVYEPRHARVVPTVGRLWNAEYGGVALFGWDNFFLAWLAGLESRELALAGVIEHLRGHTPEGFLPNDNRGNGSKSWDRSQPPVGAIMVREVYRRFPEPWFLDAVIDPLLAWNRWWPEARMNEGLLSYGSSEAKNPFAEPAVRTVRTAGYESGMDDSPMYEGVPFNAEKNTLELQDVGLTSLYIADSRALAGLARAAGRLEDAEDLEARAETFAAALERLWDEERGYYLNYRTDLDRPSERRSPTLFYPLLAGVPGPERARRMIGEHLLNPDEFWGEWVLPSTTRDDPSFPSQRYWKGAIWPPLNFLTYLGLRRAGDRDAAAALAERSLAMFRSEWRRKGYVSENYSAITGAGDDPRLSSDPFHSWGTLFGIMAFVEAGWLAPPEDPLPGLVGGASP